MTIADTVIDYANREFRDLVKRSTPVELLNDKKNTICGVEVDLHNYITDESQKREIHEKLRNILINVKYKIPMKDDFLRRK